jgi:TolA-binding protein
MDKYLPDDDTRLNATEQQMRRALGLGTEAPAPSAAPPAAAKPTQPGTSRPHFRFVRDGEVPVTVVHKERGDQSGVNKLAAAQQALREQVQAREQLEHQLADAQGMIRDLQTKLAHERLARGEERQHAEAARVDLVQRLAAIEAARDAAIEAARDAEKLPRDAEKVALPPRSKPAKRQMVKQAASDDSEIVEWWIPGWKDRYRRA